MTAYIAYSSTNHVMVQATYPRPNAEIIALVVRERGGEWTLPHVWKNTVDGVEKVTANPKMNERGWCWLLTRVGD